MPNKSMKSCDPFTSRRQKTHNKGRANGAQSAPVSGHDRTICVFEEIKSSHLVLCGFRATSTPTPSLNSLHHTHTHTHAREFNHNLNPSLQAGHPISPQLPPQHGSCHTPSTDSTDSTEYQIHFLHHHCGCHGNTKFPILGTRSRGMEQEGRREERYRGMH